MPARRSLLLGLTTVSLTSLAVWFSRAGRPASPATDEKPPAVDDVIVRVPGSRTQGQPNTADADNAGTLQLTVIDRHTKTPLFCRVNVIGSDGHFYEPAKNPLSPWSLQRLGNRTDKGPVRYFGWFFYCNGQCRLRVPPGKTRIEVWKGFEYAPVAVETMVQRGRTTRQTVTITRAVDMARRGWYSGDTHIHLNRRNQTEDRRALDLAAAEDIRFAHILAMNDTRFYKPNMGDQIWQQRSGLGERSERYRITGGGRYGIMSGQEYRCRTFGHICLFGHSRLVQADGLSTNPSNWPVFGLVSDEARSLGGFAFHAHGGYEREIYADFAQNATTGVELLQFALYRGIALDGWYHILNSGFRFPAVGASDYPACRVLGDCRTYAQLDQKPNADAAERPDFSAWDNAVAAGHSFFTTGPLLTVAVRDKQPGDTLSLPKGRQTLRTNVWMQSPVADVDEIHVIAKGKIVARKSLKPKQRRGPVEWTVTVPVAESTWIAVRAFAKHPQTGRENVEAHTNPVYVHIDGKRPFDAGSLRWLLAKLDGRIAFHANREFDKRKQVLQYFRKSRRVLTKLLKNGTNGETGQNGTNDR